MADSVTDWVRGYETSPGAPSKGYDYIDFKWNIGSGTSHGAQTSDLMPQIFHDEVSLICNIGASALDNNMTVKVLGSMDKDLALAKWDVVKEASFLEAVIDEMQWSMEVNFTGGDVETSRFQYYKLQLDPSANPGADRTVRIGIVPGKH